MTKACELADEVERDIRIAIWNACKWQGTRPNDVIYSLIERAIAEPTMQRAITALRSPSPTREAVLEEAARIAEQYVSFPQPTSRAAQWWEREVTRHTIASKIRALSPNPEPIVGQSGDLCANDAQNSESSHD